MRHKRYFAQSSLNYSWIFGAILLIPLIWLGWKATSERWLSKFAINIVELISVTFSSFFRRLILNYLNQYLNEYSKRN